MTQLVGLIATESVSVDLVWLSTVKLVWMNYVWLDPLDRGYVGNRNDATGWMSRNWLICCVRLKFEKSSPRWRIIAKHIRVKSLVVF